MKFLEKKLIWNKRKFENEDKIKIIEKSRMKRRKEKNKFLKKTVLIWMHSK